MLLDGMEEWDSIFLLYMSCMHIRRSSDEFVRHLCQALEHVNSVKRKQYL